MALAARNQAWPMATQFYALGVTPRLVRGVVVSAPLGFSPRNKLSILGL
ncbi:hypothetical protein [Pseudoalteromonas sp. SaAl2]